MTRRLGLTLLLAALGCARRPDRVVIGVVLTRSNHSAVELAAREIAAQGGIRGVPVQLYGLGWTVHETFEPARLAAWCERFATIRDLVAVIGPSDSRSTLTAASILNQRRVPELVTIATTPSATSIGPYTYRLCLSDAAQARALATYAVTAWGKRRIAVFYANDEYGWGLEQLFEARARELGAEVVSAVTHRDSPEDEDLRVIQGAARRLARLSPPVDLVVLAQRKAAATQTLEALQAAGVDVDVLAPETLSVPDFVASRPSLTRRVRVSAFYLPSPSDAAASGFVERYRKTYGTAPDYGQAFAYDAVRLVADAVAANGFSREGVRAYLDSLVRQGTTVHGAGGAFAFREDHDARRPLFVMALAGGKQTLLAQIEPP
jgi:branched-chain amino acid transport system substrate-binding protein